MLGNPVNYDKKFKDNFPIFPAKFDSELKKYLTLLKGSEVLDLGIGQGRNSIPLAEQGFNVTGVDFSQKCLEICKNNCPKLNLVQSDIRKFKIEKNKFNLIMSRCVLHFFHKDDCYEIINNIKENLKNDGLVYIHVFSIEDPKCEKYSYSHEFEKLENNIFHNTENNTYVSFFTKAEVKNIFKDFETISISEDYFLDLGGLEPHYSGVIKYIGKKN